MAQQPCLLVEPCLSCLPCKDSQRYSQQISEVFLMTLFIGEALLDIYLIFPGVLIRCTARAPRENFLFVFQIILVKAQSILGSWAVFLNIGTLGLTNDWTSFILLKQAARLNISKESFLFQNLYLKNNIQTEHFWGFLLKNSVLFTDNINKNFPREATVKKIIWTASSDFGTYRLCEQWRFRRACVSTQSRQNLRCSLIQAVSQEEPSDRKPDPWPLWMAGHAQLKFVMTECSKTQIRLTGLILKSHH